MKYEIDDKNKALEEVRAWIENPDNEEKYSEILRISHALAEAQYLPAKTLFIEGLYDQRWWWREDSISLLAFHYSLEEHIVDRIRELLLNDPDDNVRMTAASALGSRSTLPDRALLTALQTDPDDLVREVAFGSILELVGVPMRIIFKEQKRVELGEIAPSLDEVRRVVKDAGVEVQPHFLELQG